MSLQDWVLSISALVLLAGPVSLVLILGITSLIGRPLPEPWVGRVSAIALGISFVAAVVIASVLCCRRAAPFGLTLGNWVSTPDYSLRLKLLFDWLSLPYLILSLLLCGTIAAFTTRYLHRDSGFHRFFILFAIFVLGMVMAGLAGTVETLFIGWELVGLSSVLLVAYFQERSAPPANGMRVWLVYRSTDAALLLAAVLLHHLGGAGDFAEAFSGPNWEAASALGRGQFEVGVIGLLFVIAAAGKSALLPFSGWLPRAMEGPTPSSAIFYGALSVHLGAYLLLRIAPIFEQVGWLSWLVMALGFATAVYAYWAGAVQTDIKSALAFASLLQVGLIVLEIGWGWRVIPLVHLIGNASLRTLQFIRAPTLLHDYHLLEGALGEHLPGPTTWVSRFSGRLRIGVYRLGLERGYLDAALAASVVRPFVRLATWLDDREKAWQGWLSGGRGPREHLEERDLNPPWGPPG